MPSAPKICRNFFIDYRNPLTRQDYLVNEKLPIDFGWKRYPQKVVASIYADNKKYQDGSEICDLALPLAVVMQLLFFCGEIGISYIRWIIDTYTFCV